MRHLIYDGGNLLSLPWELNASGHIGKYAVLPAEHHKRRTIELEKHIDTSSRNWQGAYDGLNNESDKPLVILNGDEIGTHVVGRGWLLRHVVYHVKSVGVGTIEPFVELENGLRVRVTSPTGAPLIVDLSKPGHYIGYIASGVPDDDGNPATPNAPVAVPVSVPAQTVSVPAQTITVGGETVSIPAQNVTVPAQTVQVDITDAIATAAAGGISAPLPLLTNDNGFLGFVYKGAAVDPNAPVPALSELDGCFGTYLALGDYWDEHKCECAPKPCDTQYPGPLCDGDYLPDAPITTDPPPV